METQEHDMPRGNGSLVAVWLALLAIVVMAATLLWSLH